MSASDTRKATLASLRQARTSMMSAGWLLALENRDEATRNDAAKELLRTQQAIRKLEDEQLAEIRDRLVENEPALAEGRQHLERALQDLQDVRQVLQAVTGLLRVVGRVVALMA